MSHKWVAERPTARRPSPVATATAMAGALWQMATPGEEVQALFRREPRFAHALVEVGPQLSRILAALLSGFQHTNAAR